MKKEPPPCDSKEESTVNSEGPCPRIPAFPKYFPDFTLKKAHGIRLSIHNR